MFISELPDDCLLIIFDLINELDDLLNCYKVCSKWSHLIEERTRKVKYLVEHQDWRNDEPSLSYPFGWVFYRTEEPIDGTCLSTLFPNLMIADFSDRFCEKVKHEDIVALAKKIKHLKGLFNPIHRDGRSVFQYCDQLEMVSIRQIEPCIENNGFNVKQLKLWDLTLEIFKHHVHYFPNLERLSIYNEAKPDGPYDGPILTSLKIVELELSSYDGKIIHVYYGFQFMDWCPNLQSAHIRLESNRLFVDESVKHNSLRDLVLDIYPKGIEWSELKRLFIKYPNLKNLAFYSYYRMENAHVEQLVRLLPNLVLLVVFDCGVDQKAADYVQEYNKLHGRSIKFYFDDNHHEIQSDWPQFSKKGEKISLGFDFMKNCFLKHSLFLSTFLISDDD